MCVGVPCRILSLQPGLMPMGTVDVTGEAREVCFAYLPEAQVGDYVLIQNGFAMNLLTPQEAQESWETWAELGVEAR